MLFSNSPSRTLDPRSDATNYLYKLTPLLRKPWTAQIKIVHYSMEIIIFSLSNHTTL